MSASEDPILPSESQATDIVHSPRAAPSKPSPASLIVEALTVSAGDKTLVQDSGFEIAAGKLALLLGISGSGKSTLLRVLAGLEHHATDPRGIRYSGSICWTPPTEVGGIGLVFQKPALLDELTSEQNLRLAIEHRKFAPSRQSDVEANQSGERSSSSPSSEARYWMDRLRVPSKTRISQLSGGQRQRLSLAMALAARPQVLFYDEPTTGLDSETASDVANLINQTCRDNNITSIVVTHDYESFLKFCDTVVLVDAQSKSIRQSIDPKKGDLQQFMSDQVHPAIDGNRLGKRLHRPAYSQQVFGGMADGLAAIGDVILSAVAMALAIFPRWSRIAWGFRFFLHFFRLVSGFTAVLYLALAGLIVGFVATYFTLEYMPYRVYTEPLLIEELVAAIGFALFRIFIPVLSTILVAARSAAAVSADLGNKRYGGQIEAMEMSGVPASRYFRTAVVWAFLLGSVILNAVAFASARLASLAATLATETRVDPYFWSNYFHSALRGESESGVWEGAGWVLTKLLLSGFGTAVVTYHFAVKRKLASTDVSRSITTVILTGTIWVLLVHLIVSLIEFQK